MDAQRTSYKQRMDAFYTVCREKGFRLTPQRLEVFSALAHTTEHPSAETIHRRVVKKLPTVTLDTVYRTLGTLESEGLVVRVSVVGTTQRFEANPECHHHFVCRKCNAIIDVHSGALDRLVLDSEVPAGFTVDRAQIEFRGVCAKCQDKTAPRKRGGKASCAKR